MRINFSGVLVFFAAVSGFHAAAIAQSINTIQPRANDTLSEKFNSAYYDASPDFFRNRSFRRQVDFLFGTNGFTDNEIVRDSKQVHNLYEAALEQQVSSDPPIRTRDLPNPYETSILGSPEIHVNPGTQKNEIIFERRESK